MNATLNQILVWVKANDNHVVFKDKPYMDFMAEYQDWGFVKHGLGQLHVGYFAVDDWGDVTYDPLFIFALRLRRY